MFNTGDGLKTLDAVSSVVGPVGTIGPSTDEFDALGVA